MFEVRRMDRRIRQIGVVIGLILILTFPVTVISGAGSKKQTPHVVAATGGERNSQGRHQYRDEVPRPAGSQRIDR
jgi:hypothetical protein